MAQIFRVERTKNFTVMSNHHFKNKNLTLKANSVSYEDGRKLHNTKKDLERMKQLTNQMCRKQMCIRDRMYPMRVVIRRISEDLI